MEYKVVSGVSTNFKGAVSGVEKEVQKLIEQGYKPQGGVAIYENDASWIMACQAMIKE